MCLPAGLQGLGRRHPGIPAMHSALDFRYAISARSFCEVTSTQSKVLHLRGIPCFDAASFHSALSDEYCIVLCAGVFLPANFHISNRLSNTCFCGLACFWDGWAMHDCARMDLGPGWTEGAPAERTKQNAWLIASLSGTSNGQPSTQVCLQSIDRTTLGCERQQQVGQPSRPCGVLLLVCSLCWLAFASLGVNCNSMCCNCPALSMYVWTAGRWNGAIQATAFTHTCIEMHG